MFRTFRLLVAECGDAQRIEGTPYYFLEPKKKVK